MKTVPEEHSEWKPDGGVIIGRGEAMKTTVMENSLKSLTVKRKIEICS